jgi:hypothetical protein
MTVAQQTWPPMHPEPSMHVSMSIGPPLPEPLLPPLLLVALDDEPPLLSSVPPSEGDDEELLHAAAAKTTPSEVTKRILVLCMGKFPPPMGTSRAHPSVWDADAAVSR